MIALEVDARIALSLASPKPRDAQRQARQAVELSPHPYVAYQTQLVLAEALLRAGSADQALVAINRAYVHSRAAARALGAELHDPGLQALAISLEAQALLDSHRDLAHGLIRSALTDPALQGFHAGVAIDFVTCLERKALALPAWFQVDAHGLLRLADQLRLQHKLVY
ncbi:MAG: hypothetical protein HC933_10370 [Pleurocapsa sp. SU_196_0]|nr:hypothetical protein [Pleurocapsa sp. SU_196_0]